VPRNCSILRQSAPAIAGVAYDTAWLSGLPENVHYQHNDFRIRQHHMHDNECPNGHAHCLQFLLGSSETVPVMNAELQLGQWQRIFLVELDGPRAKREVLVQTVGAADHAIDTAA
jgi:secondary thiamine-phosphate synthase enzyme